MDLIKTFSHLYTLNKCPVNKTVLKNKFSGFQFFTEFQFHVS